MAIETRSPHFESISHANASYGILNLYIWTENRTQDVPTNPTYTIRKSATTPATGNPRVTFETSELIRDYLDTEFDGNYTGQGVWVRVDFDVYNSSDASVIDYDYTIIAFDGYRYFEEEFTASPLMITNRKLFVLEDNTFRIPIYTNSNPTITFLKDNEIISTQTFQSSDESDEQIRYVSIYGDTTNWDTFKERVLEDSHNSVYESNKCLEAYFNDYSIGAVDKIIVSDSNGIQTINVEILEECKYEPKKVTFVNKFGALQDMYFFKKSVEKMNIKKESYKSNILNVSTYNSSNHVYRDFNVVGRESVTLSSGFLSEEYNEVFKQMMLSEKVWVTNITEDGEQVLPINVKTSDITYKTSLNDKLVEYTIEFDKSFDTINNIR